MQEHMPGEAANPVEEKKPDSDAEQGVLLLEEITVTVEKTDQDR